MCTMNFFKNALNVYLIILRWCLFEEGAYEKKKDYLEQQFRNKSLLNPHRGIRKIYRKLPCILM